MDKQRRSDLIYLTALAALTTFLTIALGPGEPTGPDIDSYVPIANAISADPGYLFTREAFQSNFWSMGYPTLLAGMLAITGSLEGVAVFQAVLVGSLVFVPWLLTRHIPGPTRLIAPAVLAVTPAMWGIGTSIAYETTYAVVLGYALGIAWSLKLRSPNTTWSLAIWAALSGFLIGLGVLIQSKTLIVVPVIAALLISTRRRAIWAGLIGFLIAIGPWVVRNIFVLGTANPLAENGPFNVWVGNNPVTVTGGSMLNPPPVPVGSSPVQASIDFMVSQPERAVELIILKSARLVQPLFVYPELLQPGPTRTFIHLLSAAMTFLVASGVVVFLGARILSGPAGVPNLTAPAVFVALFFAVHLPFIAEPRYMVPVLPVSTAIAITAWLAAAQRIRANRLTKR